MSGRIRRQVRLRLLLGVAAVALYAITAFILTSVIPGTDIA